MGCQVTAPEPTLIKTVAAKAHEWPQTPRAGCIRLGGSAGGTPTFHCHGAQRPQLPSPSLDTVAPPTFCHCRRQSTRSLCLSSESNS